MGCLAKTRGSCFHYEKFYDDPALKQIAEAFKPRLAR